MKVEGGQVEGGAERASGTKRQARSQAGGRVGIRVAMVGELGQIWARQGRVSEALVFLGLPLPAALTSAKLFRGI